MKRLFNILITITLLITITTGVFRTSAQTNTNKTPQDPFGVPRAMRKDFPDVLTAKNSNILEEIIIEPITCLHAQ